MSLGYCCTLGEWQKGSWIQLFQLGNPRHCYQSGLPLTFYKSEIIQCILNLFLLRQYEPWVSMATQGRSTDLGGILGWNQNCKAREEGANYVQGAKAGCSQARNEVRLRFKLTSDFSALHLYCTLHLFLPSLSSCRLVWKKALWDLETWLHDILLIWWFLIASCYYFCPHYQKMAAIPPSIRLSFQARIQVKDTGQYLSFLKTQGGFIVIMS
jgi:hypothetical protein